MDDMESHEECGGYGDNDIGYVEIRKIFEVDEIRHFPHPDTLDAVSDGSCQKRRIGRVHGGFSAVPLFFEVEVRHVRDERNREDFQRNSRHGGGKRDSLVGLVP